MIRVLLVNGTAVPHYRVPIYGYLGNYLKSYGFELTVTAESIQQENHPIGFEYAQMLPSVWALPRLVQKNKIDVVIFWVNLKELYLFPALLIIKLLLGKKLIYWGHGRDLADTDATIKNMAYAAEHALCDSVIIYAEHLKKYIARCFHKKVFVANNTLFIDCPGPGADVRDKVLAEYGIHTKKNIICVGRFEKRKRLGHLAAALAYMNRPDIGLILAGPDKGGILAGIAGDNIYKLGPIYGEKKYDLLSAADVYCLPGAVGLSIVDAFHCGLPLVTEEGDESPEIMYIKNGINGFIVPQGDTIQMAQKLLLLLDNDELRRQFSDAAKKEIDENGHIDKLCAGFRDALFHVLGRPA